MGHVKLVDFGFAKCLMNDEKTFTICGTCEYIAPEVTAAEGYGKAVDLWSAGILLYEMLTGFTPYYDTGGSVIKIYEQIMTSRLKFPAEIQPRSAMASFISALLFINPTKRLGCGGNGFQDIRNHAWFNKPGKDKFDWGKLERLEMIPPCVPTCSPLPQRKVCYNALHMQLLRFEVCPNWNPQVHLLA